MYSFLLKSAVLPEQAYDFFVYQGQKPVVVDFRGKPIEIKKGTRFGVRPSTSGKHVRLIFPSDPTRVITLDERASRELAKGVKEPA
jgi:hypothetical protein